MLAALSARLNQLLQLLLASWPLAGAIVASLWVIHFINYLFDHALNRLGIRPRVLSGLIGIPCSIWLHVDSRHLFFNSLPLFFLLCLLLTLGVNRLIRITIIITVIQGLLLWICGKKGIHIGSSGLIMGYLTYITILGYHSPSLITIILAAVALYYFGTLFLSIFPSSNRQISWEGHLCGVVAAIIAVYESHCAAFIQTY